MSVVGLKDEKNQKSSTDGGMDGNAGSRKLPQSNIRISKSSNFLPPAIESNTQQDRGRSIFEEHDVHIKNKTKQELDNILSLICACLNTKGAKHIFLKNIQWEKAIASDFDIWFDRLEKAMQQYFFKNTSDHISKDGHCNSPKITITVDPKSTSKVFTLDTYLYYPSITSINQAQNGNVIEILSRQVPIAPLQMPGRNYCYDKTVDGLRGENETVQFKNITGSNIPNTLANMASKYVSAFGNFEGGCIYFGIEDKRGTVMGIDLSSTKREIIEHALEIKISGLQWWTKENYLGQQNWTRKKLNKGEHWAITFCDIENLPDDNKERKIIEVFVNKLPGGVFTELPQSYYLGENGIVTKYEFLDWICSTHRTYGESPATRAELRVVGDNVMSIQEDVQEIRKTVQPISGEKTGTQKRDKIEMTNITEWELDRSPIYTENSEILEKVLSDKNKKCVILKGLVGTGKSELALRYCYNFSKNNASSFVWMIKCTDLMRMETTMRELCFNLQDKDKETDQFESKNNIIRVLATFLLEKLREDQNEHLLMFDDVKEESKDHVDKIIDLCIKSLNVKTIVTTQVAFQQRDSLEIVEVLGFSTKEAVDFLADGLQKTEEEEQSLQEISARVSRNPKGLHIVRTYMKHLKLTPKAFLKRLGSPTGMLKIEGNKLVKSNIKDETLFQSLLRIISDIDSEYSSETFEMLLMLQFLPVEKIPVRVFSNLQKQDPCFTSDNLICAVENCSFGRVDGLEDRLYDHRLLSTHDVVVLALEIYMELKKDELQYSKKTLLKKLLNPFFLLLDKDNKSKDSLQQHTLLLPHAKAVIGELNRLMSENEIFWQITGDERDIDLLLKMIYINDLVGYTASFNKMNEDLFYGHAKRLLFKMLKIDEQTFDKYLYERCKDMKDFSDFSKITTEPADTFKNAIRELVKIIGHETALQRLSREFVLYKNRSSEDMKMLMSKLDRPVEKLRISEKEYNSLAAKGYAVPFESLWIVLFYDFVISVLHTFGRRLFYMPEHDNFEQAKLYCSYLHVSHHLSVALEHNPTESNFNFLSSILTERSIMQSAMDSNLGFNKKQDTVLQRNLKLCKDRVLDQNNYVEYGTLKVSAAQDEFNKVLWIKQIIRIYKLLIINNKDLAIDCILWAEQLEGYMSSMVGSTAYQSLKFSLGELYFEVGEHHKADKCFEELLPNFVGQPNKSIVFTKYERRACLNYIKCRITSEENDVLYNKETLEKLMVFKKGLKEYKPQLEEIEVLEKTLNVRIKALQTLFQ